MTAVLLLGSLQGWSVDAEKSISDGISEEGMFGSNEETKIDEKETAEIEKEEQEGESEEAAETDAVEESEVHPLFMLRAPGTGGNSWEPSHKKTIEAVSGQEDRYRITLDVTGGLASETNPQKVDVLLVVDTSNSMNKNLSEGTTPPTRLTLLKNTVTGTNGITQAILNNPKLDGRIAVVNFDGDKDKGASPVPWDDAYVARTWDSSKANVDAAVQGLHTVKNETNCQAGVRKGIEVLGSARADAMKYFIFLSDGQPNHYYLSNGLTERDWGGTPGDPTNNNPITELEAASGMNLSGFYTIAYSSSVSSNSPCLAGMRAKAVNIGITNVAGYEAKDATELSNAFKAIEESITNYSCKKVTIKDTLSDYVDFTGTDTGSFQVTKTLNGQTTNVPTADVTVMVDATGKTVTAKFRDDYVLEQGATYKLSFVVKPSQKAYDEMSGTGYPTGLGGFYSNQTATLTYTYKDENTVQYYERPTFQIQKLNIPVEKTWENVTGTTVLPVSVKVNLYQDGSSQVYKTLTLTKDGNGQWKGTFENVAKGHTYRLEEEAIPGYHMDSCTNTGTTEKPSFRVVNRKLPTLTVEKEVRGEYGNKNRSFRIQVEASKKGVPLTGSYVCVKGSESGQVTFVAGKATVSLKHGETVEIKDLPVGTQYRLEEEAASAKGYIVTYEDGDGVLQMDTRTKVTNTGKQIIPTGVKRTILSTWPIILMVLAGAALTITYVKLRERKREGK